MILKKQHLFFNHQDTKNNEKQFFWGKTSTQNFFLLSLVSLVPWWLMLFLFLIPSLGRSQILTGAGDAFPSMNLPDGAKASALGGAFSAWADDTSAIYWNPAGMVWLPKIQIETAFNQWFQDSFFQDMAIVWPKDWGAIGARISYVNLGSITLRNDNGNPTGGTVIPEDWGGTFAAAGKLGNLSVGLAAKVYSETLSTYYGYGGLGIDAGALYKLGDLDLAGGVRNIGIVTGYNYPTEAYTGAALALGPKSLLFHLASDPTFTDGGVIVHHGLEIGYQQTVFLRAGYQWLPQPLPSQDQAGLSGGAGIALGDVNIDYAMTSYGNLGLTNQVSISYQFTEPKGAAAEQEDDEDARVSNNGGSRGDEESEPAKPAPTAAPQIKIKVSPSPPTGVTDDGTQLTMRDAYHMGIKAYKARDYEKAVRYLKKSLAFPSVPAESVFRGEANSMLGIIYQFFLKSPGSLDLARQYYQSALKIDPANSTAQKHLPQAETN